VVLPWHGKSGAADAQDRGYAKETMIRALAAARKRHAHLLAQKELDQQNADGAASPQDEMQQTTPMSKTSVGSQR
jgi:site-specific recombinase XerC